MVELRMRKREMRGDGTNHHEKLVLYRILCAGQFTISNTAGTCPDLACIHTDTRSSQPNKACYTSDFSYRLVSSMSFSSSFPTSLFLVLKSTIIAEQNVKPSLSISLWRDHDLTLSTTSTQDRVSSINSYDFKLTAECSFILRHAFLYNQPPSASSAWVLKGKVTLSHVHSCKLTN